VRLVVVVCVLCACVCCVCLRVCGEGRGTQLEKGSFPPGTDFEAALSLYFMMTSIQVTCAQLSVVAATFARGGVCPTTGERVLSPTTVRACLSLLASCGMYNYSGEWQFSVGVPAKGSPAGAILFVIPNVMVRRRPEPPADVCLFLIACECVLHVRCLADASAGGGGMGSDHGTGRARASVRQGLCTFSPPLDEYKNSVRGVAFGLRLVDRFSFHTYDVITGGACGCPMHACPARTLKHACVCVSISLRALCVMCVHVYGVG
jgi:hypothetical protein